jgi:hypothetical protein
MIQKSLNYPILISKNGMEIMKTLKIRRYYFFESAKLNKYILLIKLYIFHKFEKVIKLYKMKITKYISN